MLNLVRSRSIPLVSQFHTSSMAHIIPATVKKTITGDYGFTHAEVPSQAGKTFIVTGGTNGIRLSYSRTLYSRGARLYVLSSSESTGADGVAYIKTGDLDSAPVDYKEGFGSKKDPSGDGAKDQPGEVNFVQVNLEDLNDVARVAKELKQLDRIDVVANIAGKGVNAFSLTKDGYDSHLTMNCLSHHLLLSHLLPTLEKTSEIPGADVRIVNMASEQHRGTFGGPGTFGDKFRSEEEFKKDIGPANLYNRSKLCNILFTKALVEKHLQPPSKVLAYALHPGAVATGQTSQYKAAYGETMGGVIETVVRPIMRTPAEGAYSALWASTAPEARSGEYENGMYLTDPSEEGHESGEANDPELKENFWNQSETIIKKVVGAENFGGWKA